MFEVIQRGRIRWIEAPIPAANRILLAIIIEARVATGTIDEDNPGVLSGDWIDALDRADSQGSWKLREATPQQSPALLSQSISDTQTW